MNLALSAVLIFILLIPPIAFYVSYSYGRFTKAGPKFTLLDGILASAIFSMFIHALGVLIVQDVFNINIRFDIFLKIFGGELKDLENKIPNDTWSRSIKGFAAYNFVVFSLAICGGKLARQYVIRKDIHWSSELMRLNNKWWYIFNGYDPEGGDDRKTFDFVLADIAVDTSDGALIYSGTLIGAAYNGEELERVFLTDVIRREMKETVRNGNEIMQVNRPSDGISIPSEIMAIPYTQIKNINLNFIVIPDELMNIADDPDAEVIVTPQQ